MANSTHEFSLRASLYTEALILSREDFDEIAEESVKFVELVENEALKQEQFVGNAIDNHSRRNVKVRVHAPGSSGGGGTDPSSKANNLWKRTGMAAKMLKVASASPVEPELPSTSPPSPA